MTYRQSPFDRDAALTRARQMLDAYGADPARWPDENRDELAAFLADGELDAARAEAIQIDAALARSPTPKAGDALQQTILKDFDARRTGEALLARLGFGAGRGARRFIPAGALAALSAIGFFAGAATTGAANAATEEFMLYSQASITVDYDEEAAFWAVD